MLRVSASSISMGRPASIGVIESNRRHAGVKSGLALVSETSLSVVVDMNDSGRANLRRDEARFRSGLEPLLSVLDRDRDLGRKERRREGLDRDAVSTSAVSVVVVGPEVGCGERDFCGLDNQLGPLNFIEGLWAGGDVLAVMSSTDIL